MFQVFQAISQVENQRFHPRRDALHADVIDEVQSDFHRRDVVVIQGSVFKTLVAAGEETVLRCHRYQRYRTARKPGFLKLVENAVFHQKATYSGRVAKDFIEGNRYKIRFPHRQIKPCTGNKCSSIQKDIVAQFLCTGNPLQGVLYT